MSIHKILFITLTNIGDVVLTLPVLSALKDNFPTAKIDVVVGPRPKDIFTGDTRTNKIFVYDKHWDLKKKIEFIKALRVERYDMAVDMRASLVPILIGARNRTGLISLCKTKEKHKRLVHLDKLKGLGIKYRDGKNVYVDSKDRNTIERLLKEAKVNRDDILIGISPSCRSLLKQWQTKGFIEVINGLLKEGDYKIVLIGDEKGKSVSKEIVSAIRDERLIDLTGKINLNELFALIERLKILLTGDSACLHIASDIGIKVVAIFGPTDPEEYGPTGKDDIVIRKNLKCSPCKKAQCPFGHECMKEISTEEVLKALSRGRILFCPNGDYRAD